ncbi:DNA internalization-related competence protein ComEC/Rec2 [Rhodocaloribacter sp.]
MRPDSSIHWNAYPAALMAGGLAVGVALADRLPGAGFRVWFAVSALGLAPALLAWRYGRRRLVTPARLMLYGAATLALVGLGAARLAAERALPPHHVATLVRAEGRQTTLEGRVADEPVAASTGTRFTLSVSGVHAGRRPRSATGDVLVTLSQPPWADRIAFPDVWRGDVVRLRGRLLPLPEKRNPADFDYGAYLRRRGIHARLLVTGANDVARLGRAAAGPERFVTASRAYVRTQIERRIPDRGARAVLSALLLGDRHDLGPDTRAHFAETGLMHVLAVSGLHVLLIGMALYGLLRPLLMRLSRRRLSWRAVETLRAVVTLAVLVYFMMLTGARPSVVRAVLMAGVFILLTLAQRNAHTLNTLGAAAVVMLLWRPYQLFDVGFQLSFAAVAALVTLHPVFTRALPERWTGPGLVRKGFTMVSMSLAATLGTLPILLFHFGHASFAGLVLNLAAIPLTGLTLTAALFMLVFGGAGFIGGLGAMAATGAARLLLFTAETGAEHFGWAAVHGYVTGPWTVLAMVTALVLLAQWPRPRTRWRLGALALAFAAAGLWTAAATHLTPRLDVLFFDVGQGDAALVTLPNGRRLLIDAGVRNAYTDRGVRTLLPHLERFGIDRLDAVVVSHPHSDHLGGLPALLRAVPVTRVLDNGAPHASALFDETTRLLDSLGVAHRALAAGDTLALDPSVRIQALSPPRARDAEDNDASVVLRLVFGETSMLFMGDAEANAEARLVAHYGSMLRSDVVKVGHHGSVTSSTPAFVAAVTGDAPHRTTAVISAGRDNRFGFPDEDVVRRWERSRARVRITAREGAVWLRSDGEHVRPVTWR